LSRMLDCQGIFSGFGSKGVRAVPTRALCPIIDDTLIGAGKGVGVVPVRALYSLTGGT